MEPTVGGAGTTILKDKKELEDLDNSIKIKHLEEEIEVMKLIIDTLRDQIKKERKKHNNSIHTYTKIIESYKKIIDNKNRRI